MWLLTWQIFRKYLTIKIHENPPIGSHVVPCRQTCTDRWPHMKELAAFHNFVNTPTTAMCTQKMTQILKQDSHYWHIHTNQEPPKHTAGLITIYNTITMLKWGLCSICHYLHETGKIMTHTGCLMWGHITECAWRDWQKPLNPSNPDCKTHGQHSAWHTTHLNL